MVHGTGDLFASGLTAAIYAGKSLVESVEFAGTLVRDAMKITPEQPDWETRGVSFESVLGEVTDLLA
jgi:pyridoxine kinase